MVDLVSCYYSFPFSPPEDVALEVFPFEFPFECPENTYYSYYLLELHCLCQQGKNSLSSRLPLLLLCSVLPVLTLCSCHPFHVSHFILAHCQGRPPWRKCVHLLPPSPPSCSLLRLPQPAFALRPGSDRRGHSRHLPSYPIPPSVGIFGFLSPMTSQRRQDLLTLL